ncbi:MAG TPA: PAS domain-containing sensor histidine kinase [Stellaceae bacterium]|nr:PAS domain-containing sensor histidine kinase [Stellaceae bacterium]
MTRRGDLLPVEGRLFTVPWQGASALALVLTTGQAEERGAAESTRAAAESERREVKSILDAAMDGVLVLDRGARILTANAGAHALFGIAAGDFVGRSLLDLLAPQSEPAARDYLDRIARNANSSHDALDVELHLKQDRSVMLAMTLARLGDDRVCAIFHDATARKAIEAQLRIAKSETQQAVAAKADFLAKVSHEIRTPLNAMIGFTEVIMAERFGAIGNERYREYLKDIHAAGTHMVSLLNDLVDLSKVETGQLDLTFTDVHLNDVTQQCVSIMQAQANRARIIIRTSLTQGLPRVVADERSLRQIALNLLANAIKFVGPGGQVIVSTALSDGGEAVLRVRDTGVGMSEKDIEAALEPFRQTATSGSWGSGGTGLGLPLTKALAEANRANFSIKSAPNAGSLIEIAFPPASVVPQ